MMAPVAAPSATGHPVRAQRAAFSSGAAAAARHHAASPCIRAAAAAVRQPHRRRRAVVVFAASDSNRLALLSPSKVNLFLRVVRRREDGYHDLASLFHVIDLGDDMEFVKLPAGATADKLVCSDPTIPHDDSNLVIKALNLFRRKTGRQDFFEVTLDKHVPHGAGLGGGSGNAATTLYAANELCGRPASNAQLLEWGGDIGSDISVFFSQGAAYCTGRGEVVEDVPPPLPLDTPLLLVKPPVGLSTPAIFKSLDLGRRSTADPRQLLADMSAARAITPALCVNDLEQPAFDNLPELAALKQRLAGEGAYEAVFMTGSGSTIVCVGSDAPPAWLSGPEYAQLFVAPTRLLMRQPGGWYVASGGASRSAAAVSAPQAAAAAAS